MKIPNELKIAFQYFDQNLEKKVIDTLKTIQGDIPIPRNFDYGIAADIRNNLLSKHQKSELLNEFFDSLEINYPDDRVGILLIAYQRFLQGREINLEGQVKSSKAYWKPILECEEKQRLRRLKIFSGQKIGDTLNIQMPVSKNNSVVDYSCPYLDWDFNPEKDLMVNGIITEKYFRFDSTDMALKVKVLTKNHPKTEILMEKVNVGDEFEVTLRETAWKIKTTGNNVYN